MTYKHDAVIRAWLDGKTIQHFNSTRTWKDICGADDLTYMPTFNISESFRIKPKTIQYRKYLYTNLDQSSHIGMVTTEYLVDVAEKSYGFVRWIDPEWQEVGV